VWRVDPYQSFNSPECSPPKHNPFSLQQFLD
jgi:hypothetical protein